MTEGQKSRKNERGRELVQIYREQKRCIRCGTQDERTLRGLCRCEKCAEKLADYKSRRNKSRRKENGTDPSNGYRDKYRAKCREEHRCIDCGKQDERTLSGHPNCAVCHAKRSEMQKRYREKCKIKKMEAQKRKAYHILKLLQYPLITAPCYKAWELDAETYTMLLKKARRREKRANGNERSN